jgi:DNA-binding CsgD family transcriptional regulator
MRTKSKAISANQWRTLLRLSSDLAGMPATDVEGGARLLLKRLLEILGGVESYWISGVRAEPGDGAAPNSVSGWRIHAQRYLQNDPAQVHTCLKCLAAYPEVFLESPQVKALLNGVGRHRRHRRAELVDKATCNACAFAAEVVKDMDGGDVLVASYTISPRAEIFYGIHRAPGDAEFGERERHLLLEALTQLGWFQRRLARSLGLLDARTPLTPRQRQLLGLLLTGASEKEIAEQLQITALTVHQYVKEIYRNFSVHSRAELMALWLKE